MTVLNKTINKTLSKTLSKTQSKNRTKGFTLVELITVMLITGIISMMVVNMITTPMEAFSDMKRRAELVDIAEITLHKMAREIRRALPNSIKIATSGTVTSIGFLRTVDGGRYASSGSNIFEANKSMSSFNLAKHLSNISNADVIANPHYLVVYNLGQGGADAYQGNNISTITGLPLTPDVEVTFNNFTFPFASPSDRFMIVDQSLVFMCDTLTKQMKIYSDYNFRVDLGGIATPVDMTQGNLLANNIASCDFKYNPGSATRAGLVTLQISINDSLHTNETVTLLHQIFVENQP